MLKAINAFSFPDGTSTSDMIRLAAEHGYEALEPAIDETGDLNPGSTEADCSAVVEEAGRHGIAIRSVASGLYWKRSLGDVSQSNREQAREDLKKMIRITSWLGADTLLTIPGAVDIPWVPSRPRQSYEEVLRNSKEGLENVLPAAEEHGVRLAIENVWSRFLLSPTEMRDYIDCFGSPWIGAYVDVANMLPYGYPEDWIRTLAHRVYGVHFKDFRKSANAFVDLLAGDVDWPEVMAALKEIGYDGPVAAEMSPYRGFPLTRLTTTSSAMDAILGC